MQRRNEDALMRLRAAAIDHEHAMAEQMAQRRAMKPGTQEDEHMAMYQEELKGGGGFAGAESKKRRGVSQAAPDPRHCGMANSAAESRTTGPLSQLQPSRNARVEAWP